jgi:hypothetical protein
MPVRVPPWRDPRPDRPADRPDGPTSGGETTTFGTTEGSRPVADAFGAPVLRDQGPIGRPGTARSMRSLDGSRRGRSQTTPRLRATVLSLALLGLNTLTRQ